MQLEELLLLPVFKDFQLIAGKNGLKREIRNVDILEYEWFKQNFTVFSEADFVLTSLFFAKDEPQLIYQSFLKLLERKISAIAVKTVFYEELPPEVIQLAEANNLPLFTFTNAYMEDLIIGFNELQKSHNQHLFYEEKIQRLIDTSIDKTAVEATAKEINTNFLPYVTAFYLTSRKNPHSLRDISLALNALLYKKYRSQQLFYVSFLKYNNGFLVLYTADNANTDATDADTLYTIKNLLSRYDINSKDFYIGISRLQPTFTHLHNAIQESLDANSLCQKIETSYLFFRDLGIYQELFPLSRNFAINNKIRLIINEITTYDQKFTSNLLTTLITYVNHNGEIAATAKTLFQHPNTIRYRLQKAQKLLYPYLGEQNFYEQLFILLKIYQLSEAVV